MKNFFVIFSFVTILSIVILGHTSKDSKLQPLEDNTFYYNLSVASINNELQFDISLAYKSYSTHIIQLPDDYYGTPNLYKWVTKISGTNGTSVIDVDNKPGSRRIIPNKTNEVYINYTIKYDPAVMDNYSYAPNVSPSHFYMAGCQWILPIGPIDSIYTYKIKMGAVDNNWTFYSSLSENNNNINVKTNFDDLISAGFGGSDESQIKESFVVGGNKVSLFIQGNYSFDKKTFIKNLKEIITAEKAFFNDYNQRFYYITILPRTGLLAGASVPNLFYCFVDSAKQGRELYRLIAHEYFHNWLPNKIYIPTKKGDYDFKLEWFSEGFTEYFSRKILFDNNIIDKEYYVNTFNSDIISIANNPSANESYNEIAERSQFGAAQKKLSYYRGALIALKWDSQLKRKESSLKNLMLFLFKKASDSKGTISESDIYDYANRYSLDFKKDIEKYIVQGKPIDILSDAFEGYQLKNERIRLFDPGFDVIKSVKEKIIRGVDTNGPAYKAGLRDGMKYVKRRNSNRWSNSWSETTPYSVTVITDEKEKEINFFPWGKQKELLLYKK